MSCYMRQMHWMFDALGLEYDKANRKRADLAIREILEMPDDAHCPEVWAAIKALTDDERAGLPAEVAKVLGV